MHEVLEGEKESLPPQCAGTATDRFAEVGRHMVEVVEPVQIVEPVKSMQPV